VAGEVRPAFFAGCRGVLLMGGRSARLGRDKAWVSVGGTPLWARQVRLLESRMETVWRALAYGATGAPDDLVDPVPYPGPWWAIRSALARLDASSPWLVVLAVDLVCASAELLDRLWAARLAGGITLPTAGTVSQPLFAVWHRAVLDRTRDLEPFGTPVRRVVERVPVRPVPLVGQEVRWLQNLNTPADLAALGACRRGPGSRRGPDVP
jgi:molybdopterin-guanine dinucleotide biosynthesis protein A